MQNLVTHNSTDLQLKKYIPQSLPWTRVNCLAILCKDIPLKEAKSPS